MEEPGIELFLFLCVNIIKSKGHLATWYILTFTVNRKRDSKSLIINWSITHIYYLNFFAKSG